MAATRMTTVLDIEQDELRPLFPRGARDRLSNLCLLGDTFSCFSYNKEEAEGVAMLIKSSALLY